MHFLPFHLVVLGAWAGAVQGRAVRALECAVQGSTAGVLVDGSGSECFICVCQLWVKGPIAGGLLFVVMQVSMCGVTMLWSRRAGNSQCLPHRTGGLALSSVHWQELIAGYTWSKGRAGKEHWAVSTTEKGESTVTGLWL